MTYTPIRIKTSEDPFAGIGRRPLFYVDEMEFTVPVDVPAGYALEAIEKMAEAGSDALATRWLMMEILGKDAYAALLANSYRVTKPEMAQIQGAIRELVFGETEEEGKD
jgi:hypothetical protein